MFFPDNINAADQSIHRLLAEADVEDLHILNDYITDSGQGRISVSEENTATLLACKRNNCYRIADRRLLADEIRLFGGNTLFNLFRSDGRNYDSIVRDIAKHLKVGFNSASDTAFIEESILRKLFADAFEKMSHDERLVVLSALKVKNLSVFGPLGSASVLAAIKVGGFTSYKIALIVANAIAKALLGRGLSLAGNAALTRTMGIMAGPIGWVLTGLWTIADLAGPAYRVTIPCVIQLAYIRQKAIMKELTQTCGACSTSNSIEAKFCSACGHAFRPATPNRTAGEGGDADATTEDASASGSATDKSVSEDVPCNEAADHPQPAEHAHTDDAAGTVESKSAVPASAETSDDDTTQPADGADHLLSGGANAWDDAGASIHVDTAMPAVSSVSAQEPCHA